MQFVIDNKTLLSSVSQLKRVATKRQSLPILSHILMQASAEEGLVLSATDLEVSMRQRCPATVHDAGAVTVGAADLLAVLRACPSGEIHFRSNDTGEIEVKSSASYFTLTGLDPKEFPAMHFAVNPIATATIPGHTFHEMIEKTLFAAARESYRLKLSGVYFEMQPGGKLRMVASDGHRLSVIERQTDTTDSSAWPCAILPRKGLIEASKLSQKSGDIIVFLNENYAIMHAEATELSMHLVMEEFPDYKQVIPTDCNYSITCSHEELLQALFRVRPFLTKKSRGALLIIEQDCMKMAVQNPDLGECMQRVAITTHKGEGVLTAFNVDYLIEMANSFAKEDTIEMQLKYNKKDGDSNFQGPALFQAKGDQEYMHVIMSMHIF